MHAAAPEKSDTLEYLLSFIQKQTGADHIEALMFCQLAGGAVQENHGLTVSMNGGTMPGEHHFVVRCNAPVSLSVSLSRAQEFEALRVVHQAGVRAPRPFWLCSEKNNPLGGEFYVMERVPGNASARNLVKDGALTTAQRKDLLFQVGYHLALLHQVTPPPGTLDSLPRPDQTPAHRRIDECRATLQRLGESHPALELGLWFLQQHMPVEQTLVVSHGDFRTGNYLVENGQLTAILDWEFTSWSDPYEDLGWLCARCWRFGHPEREAGGVGDKADLFAGYESVSGHRIDPLRIAYWEAMACLRWATIALEQSHRHRSGQQDSLELALTGRIVPEIQQDLMSHLRHLLALMGVSIPETFEGSLPPLVHVPNVVPTAIPPDEPGGASLLQAARALLLHDILPLLPAERHYDTRMIANAMDIAARELETGVAILATQDRAISDFYQRVGGQPPEPGMAGLTSDIRNGTFSDAEQPALFDLVDTLVRLKLLLSNPKRVET